MEGWRGRVRLRPGRGCITNWCGRVRLTTVWEPELQVACGALPTGLVGGHTEADTLDYYTHAWSCAWQQTAPLAWLCTQLPSQAFKRIRPTARRTHAAMS